MSKIEILSIGQIAIATQDIAKSVGFYRDVLSMPLLFEVPPNLAFFQANDVRLMITTLQGDINDHHTSTIYYRVADIESTFRLLIQKNVTVEREPQFVAKMPDHDLWMGFIRDPDNHLIGIMSEVPH